MDEERVREIVREELAKGVSRPRELSEHEKDLIWRTTKALCGNPSEFCEALVQVRDVYLDLYGRRPPEAPSREAFINCCRELQQEMLRLINEPTVIRSGQKDIS